VARDGCDLRASGRHEYPERFGVSTGGRIRARAVFGAGAASLIDDVRFLVSWQCTNPYNNDIRRIPICTSAGRAVSESLDYAAAVNFRRHLDSRHVRAAGFYVSDTKTPVMFTSFPTNITFATNQVRSRGELDVNAPQSEEEAARVQILILELDWSKNITIANYHAYRVTRSRAPFPRVRLYHSEDIHFRQRLCQCRKRTRHMRRKRLRHFSAHQQIPYENSIEI